MKRGQKFWAVIDGLRNEVVRGSHGILDLYDDSEHVDAKALAEAVCKAYEDASEPKGGFFVKEVALTWEDDREDFQDEPTGEPCGICNDDPCKCRESGTR